MNRTQWILLAAVFGLYLLFGAVVIMHLEAPAEEANLDELHDLRNVIYGFYFVLFCLAVYRITFSSYYFNQVQCLLPDM